MWGKGIERKEKRVWSRTLVLHESQSGMFMAVNVKIADP
jgi:hypothetical protein